MTPPRKPRGLTWFIFGYFLTPDRFSVATCGTLARNQLFNVTQFRRNSVIRRSFFASAAALLLASVGSLILMAGSAPQKTGAKTPARPGSSKSAPTGQGPITVNGVPDIDPTKAFGSKSAPVTMVVYSDFQCPACKQLFTTTLHLVMDNYVDNNKVYMVHRDFPLPMHAYSTIAAEYARAAAHIGKCEQVEQALFQNQEKWEVSGDVKGTLAAVLTPAEMKKVQELVDARTLDPLIAKDKQIGQTLPVTQTPTMVLYTRDGQTYPVVGYVSYDVLKTLLDQLVK